MKKELEMVAEFHKKVGSPVLPQPSLISEERSTFRHQLMSEEVGEYRAGALKHDLENVAKEIADILYTVYGTVLEHGLQDKIPEIFAEIHRSNMSKDFSGVKAIKGADYRPADIKSILDK
jgi:predicted HAD superfamily Cof-like phosphohydrolase